MTASDSEKEVLEKILNSGNTKKCMEFFAGMPEKTRREYFPLVKKFWSQVRKQRIIENPPGTFRSNPLESVACTAYFATANGPEILKAKRSGYPSDDYAFEILVDRRPAWVNQWVIALLCESYYWGHWKLIRRLIEAGLAVKPKGARYYLAMISGLNRRMEKVDLVTALQQSPDLLQEDVWKLFEYDGDGENSLANTERLDSSWMNAFVQLMHKGKLPRARLLEATLEALERDFNHFRARWFHEFFDRLEPTQKELKQFAPRLLGLLGATAPNVATWALGYVESLASAGAFDTATMCHAVQPLFKSRAKANVLTVLKLLQQQATAFPKSAHEVAATVALSLAHDAADVQKAALKILEAIASPQDEKVRNTVEMLQPTLAASLRGAASKWLASGSSLDTGGAAAPSNAAKPAARPLKGAVLVPPLPKLPKQVVTLFAIDVLQQNMKTGLLSIPAAIFDGSDIPRLTRSQPVAPIESVEELIDVCARVIEDGSLVDDAERCIDGLSRLVGDKPGDFDTMAAPLLKRCRKLVLKGCSPFCGLDPANDVIGLFYAFCTGHAIEPMVKGSKLAFDFEGEKQVEYAVNAKKAIGFLSARCLAVARRIAAGDAGQLLSTPTHAGGWIDPRVLAKRVNACSHVPDIYDVVLAMLRLAPDHRAAALKSLKEKSGEWYDAIRYALQADNVRIGNTAALWVAAARARAPWQDDPQVEKKHPGLGPDAGTVAKVALQIKARKSGTHIFHDAKFTVEPPVPKSVDPSLVTVQLHASRGVGEDLMFEMGGFAGRTSGAVRWTATIWPIARESYFAGSAHDCLDNLDWWEAQWQNRTMLEPLIDADTPLRYAGLLFLCSMLAAKEPGEAGLATDIAIRAIEDGRLGSDNLGDALAMLLPTGIIKPGRWQKTLKEVARSSQVHTAVVQLALQRCFVESKTELPKDSSKLLELLYELSMELNIPVTFEPCRAWLSSGAAAGKSAKVAKSLLAIADTKESTATTQSILEAAIALRTTSRSYHGLRG